MHVAITGASSGLGEAMAREFARTGAKVTAVARRREVLEKLCGELGGQTHVAAVDLADTAHCCEWIAGAEAALGPIDVLISNAGVMSLGPVAQLDPAEAQKMIALNYLAPVALLRAMLPKMLERRSGVLVNVTSMAALVTLPGWIYQSSSKTASATFSEALRREVRGSGVHVLTVYPGMTDTPMTQGGLDRYGRSGLVKLLPLGTPAGFARTVRRSVERRSARAFYPAPYALARWFPGIARWLSTAVTPPLKALPEPAQK